MEHRPAVEEARVAGRDARHQDADGRDDLVAVHHLLADRRGHAGLPKRRPRLRPQVPLGAVRPGLGGGTRAGSDCRLVDVDRRAQCRRSAGESLIPILRDSDRPARFARD
ncbi:hypothetical protein SDC9_165354 [bioreactor metagenome]|uniref:Uncharacterized protein n=1 Tax=bioreactor metagenome TaxID=1076179 RepID=A0A645FVY0_9ZZZZ